MYLSLIKNQLMYYHVLFPPPDDTFSIDEVVMFEGDHHEKNFSVSGEILDGVSSECTINQSRRSRCVLIYFFLSSLTFRLILLADFRGNPFHGTSTSSVLEFENSGVKQHPKQNNFPLFYAQLSTFMQFFTLS